MRGEGREREFEGEREPWEKGERVREIRDLGCICIVVTHEIHCTYSAILTVVQTGRLLL